MVCNKFPTTLAYYDLTNVVIKKFYYKPSKDFFLNKVMNKDPRSGQG